MGIVKFQSKYSFIFFSIGVSIGYLNMGFLGPMLLSKEQLGIVNFVISTSVLIAAIGKLGLPSTIIRYYPIYSKDIRSREFMNSINLLSLFSLFLCGIALPLLPYFSSAEFSLKFSNNFWYIAVISISFIAFQNISSYASSLQKPLDGVFLREVFLRLVVLICLILFYLDLIKFDHYMAGVSLSYVMILLIIFSRFGNLRINFKPRLKAKELKGVTNFSLFATLSNSSGILVSSLDKIMIATMLSYEATAIYSVAFMVGAVVALPQRVIAAPITPLMSKMMAHNDLDKIEDLSLKSSTMMAIVTTLLLVIILNSLNYFFDLLPKGYEEGFMIVLIIGLSNLIANIAIPLVHIITNSRLYKYDFFTNIILILLIVVTNYFGIKSFGMNGAAAATLISMFIYHSIRAAIVYKHYHLNLINKNSIIAVVIGAGLLILINYLLSSIDYYWYFFISNGLLTIVYSALIYFLKLSEDFNETIDSYLSKITK